jgi:hypothetical protein
LGVHAQGFEDGGHDSEVEASWGIGNGLDTDNGVSFYVDGDVDPCQEGIVIAYVEVDYAGIEVSDHVDVHGMVVKVNDWVLGIGQIRGLFDLPGHWLYVSR